MTAAASAGVPRGASAGRDRIRALLLIALLAPALAAQDLERSVAIGVGVPTGGLSTSRSLGPLLRGGVTLGDAARRLVRVRLDLEAGWLQGDSLASVGSWQGGTLASLSGFASLLVGGRATTARTGYAVLGVGTQRMAIANVNNPYGATMAVRVGAGVRFRAGGRAMFAELVPTYSLTDFGSSANASIATVIPLVIGVRF